MDDSLAVELYALRSPLSPLQACERVGQLGATVMRPCLHSQVIELELLLDEGLTGASINLQIEPRNRGSYITAWVEENRFLRDFVRVARLALSMYAVGIGGYACASLSGSALLWTLIGTAVGLSIVLSLFSLGLMLSGKDQRRALRPIRLRHQLASLLCR